MVGYVAFFGCFLVFVLIWFGLLFLLAGFVCPFLGAGGERKG